MIGHVLSGGLFISALAIYLLGTGLLIGWTRPLIAGLPIIAVLVSLLAPKLVHRHPSPDTLAILLLLLSVIIAVAETDVPYTQTVSDGFRLAIRADCATPALVMAFALLLRSLHYPALPVVVLAIAALYLGLRALLTLDMLVGLADFERQVDSKTSELNDEAKSKQRALTKELESAKSEAIQSKRGKETADRQLDAAKQDGGKKVVDLQSQLEQARAWSGHYRKASALELAGVRYGHMPSSAQKDRRERTLHALLRHTGGSTDQLCSLNALAEYTSLPYAEVLHVLRMLQQSGDVSIRGGGNAPNHDWTEEAQLTKQGSNRAQGLVAEGGTMTNISIGRDGIVFGRDGVVNYGKVGESIARNITGEGDKKELQEALAILVAKIDALLGEDIPQEQARDLASDSEDLQKEGDPSNLSQVVKRIGYTAAVLDQAGKPVVQVCKRVVDLLNTMIGLN